MNLSTSDLQTICRENSDLYFILECDAQVSDVLIDNNTHTADLWINALLANVIIPWSCVIGICVILATIAIIRSKCIGKSTNNYYLISLGIIDMTSLMTIFSISPSVLGFVKFPSLWKQILSPYFSTFLQMTIFLSNWITVALALDRHHAICEPFNYYSRSYTLHNKTLSMMLIITSCFFIYLPQFFLFSSYTTITDMYMENVTVIRYSTIGLNKIYENFHLWFVTFFLLFLLPVGIILLVNIHLVLCVTSSTRLLYQSTNLSFSKSVKNSFTRENIKISVLLFCLISSFICLQIPFVVLIFLANFQPKMFSNDLTYLFSRTVTFLYVLKHDINFLFYVWLSRRFMSTIQAFVCLNCNNMKRKGSTIKSKISFSKRRSSPV